MCVVSVVASHEISLILIYFVINIKHTFPGGSDGKLSAYNAGDPGSIPGLGRSPGEGNGNPFQYSCPGESHGRRSLVGYSPWGCEQLDMTERLHVQFFSFSIVITKSYGSAFKTNLKSDYFPPPPLLPSKLKATIIFCPDHSKSSLTLVCVLLCSVFCLPVMVRVLPLKLLSMPLGGPLHSCIMCLPARSLRAYKPLHGQDSAHLWILFYTLPSLCPGHTASLLLFAYVSESWHFLFPNWSALPSKVHCHSLTHLTHIRKGFLKPCSCSPPAAHIYSLSFKKKLFCGLFKMNMFIFN